MDANGQKFWMLSEPHHWRFEGSPLPVYDQGRRTLRLPSLRGALLGEAPARALTLLTVPPQVLDDVGTYARFEAGRGLVVAGVGEDSQVRYPEAQVGTVLHLAVGTAGEL